MGRPCRGKDASARTCLTSNAVQGARWDDTPPNSRIRPACKSCARAAVATCASGEANLTRPHPPTPRVRSPCPCHPLVPELTRLQWWRLYNRQQLDAQAVTRCMLLHVPHRGCFW
eukprot:350521-Chlamydomonas_euryale.AAC.8